MIHTEIVKARGREPRIKERGPKGSQVSVSFQVSRVVLELPVWQTHRARTRFQLFATQ